MCNMNSTQLLSKRTLCAIHYGHQRQDCELSSITAMNLSPLRKQKALPKRTVSSSCAIQHIGDLSKCAANSLCMDPGLPHRLPHREALQDTRAYGLTRLMTLTHSNRHGQQRNSPGLRPLSSNASAPSPQTTFHKEKDCCSRLRPLSASS